MSLRSLLSNLRYWRSQQERSEEGGLIISKRLKDLLASADGQLNTAAEPPARVCAVYPRESLGMEANDSNSPAGKQRSLIWRRSRYFRTTYNL